VIIVALIVVLLGFLMWALLFSSLLAVQTVEVRGATSVPEGDVLTAAQVETGQPLARLDTDPIVERVAALPAVERVDVSRQWPHTVVVTITERTPAISVPQPGGFDIYDESGVLFRTVQTAPEGLTELHVDGIASRDQIAAVLTVIRTVPESFAARIKTMRADTLDSIKVALTDGTNVVWGSADDSARKATVLLALMEHPASVYDVSAPEVPTTRD
jgi:cell division protein FtsQ